MIVRADVDQRLLAGLLAVTLTTGAGAVDLRYHAVVGAQAGVVWVGGTSGGLGGPAGNLYPEACRLLQRYGIAGVRLHYRHPGNRYVEECVRDVLLGAEFLVAQGIEQVALVGHSFGGAVVISSAARSERVKAVVALATQNMHTHDVSHLAGRPVLVVGGTLDGMVGCSEDVYRRATEPKEKMMLVAGHDLGEAREELLKSLVRWLSEKLLASRSMLEDVSCWEASRRADMTSALQLMKNKLSYGTIRKPVSRLARLAGIPEGDALRLLEGDPEVRVKNSKEGDYKVVSLISRRS